MKFPLIVHLILFSWLAAVPANDPDIRKLSSREIINEGEEYVYEVSWTVFKLGTIHLKVSPRYTVEARVNSYPSVPFVDLHSAHYSEMDSSFYSIGSHTAEKKETDWWGVNYIYDLPQRRLIIEETHQKDLESPPFSRQIKDTLGLPSVNFVDGLAIAFLPRLYIHSAQSMDVPTVLYGKIGTTTYDFTGYKTTEDIEALDDPVRVVEVNGTTTAVGIYGMTGDFTGWFSDDDAAVPIKGKLKVLIGSVTVELIKWNRKGWNPPQ
ncbi:MAG: hypothetical protein H6Q30_1201 [Bacteroidetes bacterium]|nr:hypothetical protein [Bacteroidota bacterium]